MLARPKATHAVHAHGLTRAPAALAHLDRAQAEEGDDQQRQAWDRCGVDHVAVALAPVLGPLGPPRSEDLRTSIKASVQLAAALTRVNFVRHAGNGAFYHQCPRLGTSGLPSPTRGKGPEAAFLLRAASGFIAVLFVHAHVVPPSPGGGRD